MRFALTIQFDEADAGEAGIVGCSGLPSAFAGALVLTG